MATENQKRARRYLSGLMSNFRNDDDLADEFGADFEEIREELDRIQNTLSQGKLPRETRSARDDD